MKKIIISLMLAGFVPASGAAQTQSSGQSHTDTHTPYRARTLDLRAGVDPWIGSSPVTCATCVWLSGETNGLNLTYSASSGGKRGAKWITAPSCLCPSSADHAGTLQRKNLPLSVTPHIPLDSMNYCDTLWKEINYYDEYNQYQEEYDSAKQFVQSCYDDPRAGGLFGDIQSDVQHLIYGDTSLWVEYRKWLESVLYLNTTNPEYFCVCVEQIAGTYNSVSDTTETLNWEEENRSLAIDRWLIQNTTCDTPLLRINYDGTRQSMHDEWLNDTLIPYDTTLPTMAQLGLDTLLAKHALAVMPNQPVSIILNATASPNPVSTGTIITFGISQEAYVKIGLFDILGHEVTSPGYEGLFAQGNHEVPLSLQGIPSGTYFARILTAYGNVATVKLVKE